jgi:YhcH/YjgK/YiaL family protein
MIHDTLSNLRRYRPLSAGLQTAIVWLSERTLDGSDASQFSISGDQVHGAFHEYKTGPVGKRGLECHRTYADIHVVLAGHERVLWEPARAARELESYDAAHDVAFYAPSDPHVVDLMPGYACVLFPEEAHASAVMTDAGARPVKKLVLKVAWHAEDLA